MACGLALWMASVGSLYGRLIQNPCLTLGLTHGLSNNVVLTLAGESGISYTLEYSTDLQSWASVTTITDAAPVATQIIGVDASLPAGFYRASRERLPLFANALAASSGITLKGIGVTIDSYDSSDPAHSTNGLYDAATRMAGGDIASITGLVDIQGATLYGHLHLGANATYSLGIGTVGDLSWTGPGIEPGWLVDDVTVCLPDVIAPNTRGWFTSPTTINPGNQTNTYLFTSGSYFLNSSFTINNNETMTVSGNVTLYVTGNFTMKSQNGSYINILPAGSLTLFVGTANTSTPVTTQLTQVNTSGNALTFQYFGLPSNNSLTWSGNATFLGDVYAPEALFSCGGGGNNNYDYQGACVVGSVSMNGHFNFHFDENLKRNGPLR